MRHLSNFILLQCEDSGTKGDYVYSKNQDIFAVDINRKLDKCIKEIGDIKSKCICFQSSAVQKESTPSPAELPHGAGPIYTIPY